MSENQKRLLWGIVLVVGGYFLLPYLIPFLVALVLAVLIEPLIQWLQRLGIRNRILSTWVALGGLALLLVLAFVLAINQAIQQITMIVERLPEMMSQLEVWVLDIYYSIPPETIQSVLDNARENLSGWLSGSSTLLGRSASAFLNFASAVPGALLLGVLTILAFVMMSMHLPKMKEYLYEWFHPESHGKLDIILHELNKGLVGYLRGQLMISFFIFLLLSLGLFMLRLPYALGIAAIVAVIDFIPVLGAGLILVPWAIWLFLEGQILVALGLLVLWLAVTLLRRIIEPKVLGDSLGMSTLTVLISMFLGFSFMGLIGLFVGPALVVVFNALRKAGLFQFQIRL